MRSPLDLLQLALEMGQRPVVLWQLLGIAIALSASALLIRVRKGADQFWLMPIASLLLGFLALLLASIGIPNEIILVIAAVFGSLTLLQVIYALLRKLRVEATLDRLFSRFARPAVIVISVALLIRAAGFEDLWSVSILPANAGGQYPLRITIGEIARSLIAFYLLFITSGLASKAGSIASKLSLGASTESSAIIAELSRYIYIFLGLIFILMSMGITGNFLIAIAASLSVGYEAENVNKQRGDGVFERSLDGLRLLNQLGYGKPGGALILNLVFNPQGPQLPPPQAQLEDAYRKELLRRYGIQFTNLFTLVNMPIQRFKAYLNLSSQLDEYQQLLEDAHNSENLETVMCRNLISVNWQGELFDCDFNQQLNIHLNGPVHNLKDMLNIKQQWPGQPITVGSHCFGCTAGNGSSCGGALQ